MPADANQLCGGAVLIGSEHHAERRDDDVEALILKRQSFSVGDAELDLQPVGIGTFAGALEQCRHVVACDHVAPAPRGGKRSVPVSGRDVEHPRTRTEVECFTQFLADDLQGRADDGVVAGGPRPLLPRFERPEVDRNGWGILSDC